MRTLLLDTGPLGEIVHSTTATRDKILSWLLPLQRAGVRIAVPATADYENRRKLTHLAQSTDPIRARNAEESIRRLDQFITVVSYLPVGRLTVGRASVHWSQSKLRNLVTAPDHDINFDLLICAAANEENGGASIIATSNPRHLPRFAKAKVWEQISLADLI